MGGLQALSANLLAPPDGEVTDPNTQMSFTEAMIFGEIFPEEGMVVTVGLALGARTMVRNDALVRRLRELAESAPEPVAGGAREVAP